MSMFDLQIAVLEDDKPEIHALLSELDRRTESEMFARAAEHFGFKTVEVHGRRLAMRSEIASVMGYKDESGLRKLAQRYDLESVSPGTFGQNVRMFVAEQLGLHKKDGKTILVGWETFLLAGMQGTNPAAGEVKIYLLRMEKAGRVAGGALSVAQQRTNRLNEADKVSQIAARIDRMHNSAYKQNVAKYLNELLDGALQVPFEGDLFGDPQNQLTGRGTNHE